MTQVLSSVFRVEIIPPAGGVLAAAFQALSPGQWGTIAVANQMNADPTGTGDGMFSYSPQLTWDTLHNVGRFFGGCHGAGGGPQRLFVGTYTDATNSWPAAAMGFGITVDTITHAYYAGTVDQQTGDFYGAAPFKDVQNVRKFSYATQSWSAPFPTNVDLRSVQSVAVVYHPGLYGGQGGIIHAGNSGIWTINPRLGSPVWNIILDRRNPVDAMGTFPSGIYDYKTQCAYVGSETNVWKIPAHSGAGAAPTTIPQPSMGFNASSSNVILMCSGNPANNMVCMDRAGNAQEFNGSTWSSFAANVPAALLNATNQWWAAGAVPVYGGIIFPKGELSPTPKTSLTMHLWKR